LGGIIPVGGRVGGKVRQPALNTCTGGKVREPPLNTYTGGEVREPALTGRGRDTPWWGRKRAFPAYTGGEVREPGLNTLVTK
jgi:hypothetical protein